MRVRSSFWLFEAFKTEVGSICPPNQATHTHTTLALANVQLVCRDEVTLHIPFKFFSLSFSIVRISVTYKIPVHFELRQYPKCSPNFISSTPRIKNAGCHLGNGLSLPFSIPIILELESLRPLGIRMEAGGIFRT